MTPAGHARPHQGVLSTACPECGAGLEAGATCRDRFHELLAFEHEVAAGAVAVPPGRLAVAHFLAVSTYTLQHPSAMNATADALAGLRHAVADLLAGRTTLDAVRRRVGRAADGATRVTRRPGEPVPSWPVRAWPTTIADALDGGVDGYVDRVESWAAATLHALDEARA